MMAENLNKKSNRRFVLHISSELRQQIEEWVNRNGVTMAYFGRVAFRKFLEDKKRERRQVQLLETCKRFEKRNTGLMDEWSETDFEKWP